MPQPAVVHRQVAGLGLDAHLGRILAVRHEVRLAEAHRPEALPVAAGDEPEAAVLPPAAVQVEADVQHLLRHAAVEEVAQAVGVPAESGIHAARHVQEAVEDDAVLLPIADARALPDQVEDRREAGIAHERMHTLGEHRREGQALEKRAPGLVLAEEERNAEHPLPALGEPRRLDALHLLAEHRNLVGCRDAGEQHEPVLAQKGALLGGDARAEGEAGHIQHGAGFS